MLAGVPNAIFVYGTLMPGHLRWGLIAPFAPAHRPATVPGALFDTGRGWPATWFREPVGARLASRPEALAHVAAATVPGWLVELEPAAVDALMARLDEVEGAVLDPGDEDPAALPGDYRRVVVTTDDGTEAWAYEALAVDPRWPVIAAWTGQAER
jgi:gamma-glutamylcyclotransferase (GGCT)/AIG2-like uncharacterized protein YtfP